MTAEPLRAGATQPPDPASTACPEEGSQQPPENLKRCPPSVTAEPEVSRATSHFTGEAVRSRRPEGWQATASTARGTSP